MSYDSFEKSEYSNHPIEIYTFAKAGAVWRYTSADRDYLVNGYNYTSLAISRANIEQTQEMARSNLNIQMTKNAPFLLQFRGSPPTSVINFSLQRFHEGENDLITLWLGRVVNVKFEEREAEVRCEPVYTSLKRPVLRIRYQTTCPHVLYGNGCRVNRSDYAVHGTVLTNGGSSLISASFLTHATGYFTGGYVDWENEGNTQRRFITSHTGDTIEINLPFAGMQGGASIVTYPGCDHLLLTCNSKFSNEENYGGQPFYGGKNPFTGSSIF